jgi:hypothetical protein
MLAQSSADFPHILGDSVHRSLMAAYAQTPKLWPFWCSRKTVSDYREIKNIDVGVAPELRRQLEGEGIRYVVIGESAEVYQLADYSEAVRLTRRALINDDLDAFNIIPQRLAEAAVRKEDLVTLAVLTANADMGDGKALFHADHANLAASGDVGAPGTATLNAARVAMRKQTLLTHADPPAASQEEADRYKVWGNIAPRVLLAPCEHETTVQELLESTLQATAAGAAVDNPWKGKLDWGVSPVLSDNSATAWYVCSSPNDQRGVQVAFLEGENVPQTRQETDFDTEDWKVAVRHTVAAKALDYRGLYKNPGA